MSIKKFKFHISTEIFYFFPHHISQSEEKSSLNVFETKLYKKRQSIFDFQKINFFLFIVVVSGLP
jgi:hypothetical protein